MANSRQKGAAFERDIVKRLNGFATKAGFDFSCKRNLDQYQARDLCDIEIPGHAIECKAYKDGFWYRTEWWEQVVRASDGRIPVLVWKFNNKPIRVTLPLYAIAPDLPQDPDRVCVVFLEEWFKILQDNWHRYQQEPADELP
jgi:Holliday junction resolvase